MNRNNPSTRHNLTAGRFKSLCKTATTIGAAAVIALAAGHAHAAVPVTSTFSYQGQLRVNNQPFTGSAEVSFALYDAPVNGNLIGSMPASIVNVNQGVFTKYLNFGDSAFDGSARWVEISVRTNLGSFTTLSPRQSISAVPYAMALRLPLQETVSVPNDNALRIHNTAVSGRALLGLASGQSGKGVYGSCTGSGGIGVYGDCSGSAVAVEGYHSTSGHIGRLGLGFWGVEGISNSVGGNGVHGRASATTGINLGVFGEAFSPQGFGVKAYNGATGGTAILAECPNGTALWCVNQISGLAARFDGWTAFNNNIGIGVSAPQFPIHHSSGARLTAGGTWTNASDRNLKENFTPVDPSVVLEKIAAMPITQWNYKNEKNVFHIGPMAQDFAAAFSLGADDKSIATVDADGVALAAIQALNEQLKNKDAEIAELSRRLDALEASLNRR